MVVRPTLRLVLVLAGTMALGGCLLQPIATPTPTPAERATAPASATAAASATASAAASLSATPDPGAIPDFTGGDLIATTIAGLRVRQLPGTDRPVITDLLPGESELAVILGPIVVESLGWYLVTDADPDGPEFEEGWVAAGFEPEPNVRSTGRVADDSPVVASLARIGNAEFGPFEVPDERHIIRWVAVDPEGVGCSFAVLLAAGSAEPVPAIRSTLGPTVVAGVLQSSYFVSQPDLRGQLFMTVESDCGWALSVLQERQPEPSASP